MSHVAQVRNPESHRLLVTKLTPPSVHPDLVSRPRLLALLDQGVERKLTLISTGPGYGKSTLAASWLATATMPGAWLSLDERDNDPHTFFSYLAAALQTIDRELGVELQNRLTGARVPAVRVLVATLINELAVVTRPFVLALDDLHAITSPEIQEGFALLVQNLPHTMRLLVTTRTDPPLPLLRMRARGELLDVRASELSFTTEETRALLGGRYALSLSEHELSEIQEWSEGWPVGLMLVGQRMRAQSSHERQSLLERIGGDVRFVNDYLWLETIEHQPPERRRFLLETALLDRFDAGLSAAVTGMPDAASMLRELERENLFLIGLDGAGRWFRYHYLFADALRERLTEEYAPEAVRELHRNAAAWLLEHGTSEEAARHALAAKDWEVALPILSQICADLNAQERLGGLRRWLESVPVEVLQRHPRLCTVFAWALVRQGNVAAALRLLETAFDDWSSDEQNAVLPTILQIRLLQAMYHQHVDDGHSLAEQALALLPGHQPDERARLLVLRAILYEMQGEVGAAETSLSELRALAPAHGSLTIRQMEENATAGNLIMQGRLDEAARNLRRVIATGDEWNHAVVPYAYWQLASILLEWNELEQCEETLRRGYEITVKASAPLHRTRFHQFLAEIAWARGESERAQAEIELAIDSAAAIGGEADVRIAQARRARFWLASGSFESARAWARASGLDPAVEPAYPRLPEFLTLLRLMVLDGRAERALDSIEPAQRHAMRSGRVRDLLDLLLLRAIAEHTLGRSVAAERSFLQALKIGEPERFSRSFIDHGQRLAPLLDRVVRSEEAQSGYARVLLEAEGIAARSGKSPTDRLSPREIEVLLLVAAGESNRAIAGRLFISEQTVKKHMSNIFEKLSVSSRTQAISRGRALGIV
jgi:LuxR family maltose regulon positive regulatory protein